MRSVFCYVEFLACSTLKLDVRARLKHREQGGERLCLERPSTTLLVGCCGMSEAAYAFSGSAAVFAPVLMLGALFA